VSFLRQSRETGALGTRKRETSWRLVIGELIALLAESFRAQLAAAGDPRNSTQKATYPKGVALLPGAPVATDARRHKMQDVFARIRPHGFYSTPRKKRHESQIAGLRVLREAGQQVHCHRPL
jgi:hypothetical protein